MTDFSMPNNAMEHSTHSLYKANIVDNVIVDGGDELKSAIQGISLIKCTVITSILRGCTLSNCTLLSCTMFNSKLDNCTIRQHIQPSLYRPFHLINTIDPRDYPPTHIRTPSILRNCETKVCVISNSIISRDSDVQGGRLALCNVKDSTVRKAVVCETLMLNCKVDNCNLNLSGHHGCKMSRTSKIGCKAVLTLRAFPPEIRSLIMKNTLNLEGPLPKHMPPLIIASRSDQTLYHEALDVMRKDSFFSMDVARTFRFTDSNPQAEYVRKLVCSEGSHIYIERLPVRWVRSAEDLREFHFNCKDVFSAIIALWQFAICDTDVSYTFEKLSLTYMTDFQLELFPKNEDDDIPRELFDKSSEITRTKTISEGKTTRIWSVNKGERLLKRQARTTPERDLLYSTIAHMFGLR